MRISSLLVVGLVFAAAAALSLIAAGFAVGAIEDRTEISLRRAFDESGLDWAEVEADGLRVILAGTAPDEATRFEAIRVAGRIVDAARISDETDVRPASDLAPPQFSAEILRNDHGISVIGLVPADFDRDAMARRLRQAAGSGKVVDLLEVADYPVPPGWDEAMDFAIRALARLPRSKISVRAGAVAVTAIADSRSQRDALDRGLRAEAPGGVKLVLDIAAPRPVITPFTLRFIIDDGGARFDACSADSEEARARIIAAARAAGLGGEAQCTIGLGVPTPSWARAVEAGIAALAGLGRGAITYADTDITLVAAEGTDSALFDRVVGELEAQLPKAFALHPVLPKPVEKADADSIEFIATLSPEGLVQMRGKMGDALSRRMAASYAKALFGSENTHMAARLAEGLPANWSVRVLAGLDALSQLSRGFVSVTPDNLVLRGESDHEGVRAEISRILADKLGAEAAFDLSITYRPPPPEPQIKAPDPALCLQELVEIQKERKISFEPGSANIAAESLGVMDRIAAVLDDCGDIRLEIQGHTDSQGRAEMNLRLSQLRAQTVLDELRARRVLTSSYRAVGYGETRPIADNETEEGREANRRIEFRLIPPDKARNGAGDAGGDGHGPAGPSPASDGAEATAEPQADQAKGATGVAAGTQAPPIPRVRPRPRPTTGESHPPSPNKPSSPSEASE